MTVCRYACAVVVLAVATLTPSSCSEFDDPVVAAGQEEVKMVDRAPGLNEIQIVDQVSDRTIDPDADLSGS